MIYKKGWALHCPACKGPAWILQHDIQSYDRLKYADVLGFHGEVPCEGDKIHCPICKYNGIWSSMEPKPINDCDNPSNYVVRQEADEGEPSCTCADYHRHDVGCAYKIYQDRRRSAWELK